MTRITPFGSPLLLGFETMEKTLERIVKASDGYPPYNIERLRGTDDAPDRLRITLAVAGFSEDELDVSVEESQLVIRGRQSEQEERDYLYRGIAAPVPAHVRSRRWHAGARRRPAQRASRRRSHPSGTRAYGKEN